MLFRSNYNIGGVDIANQLQEAYETHRATRRNWWPLFYWLIDMIMINSYRLYQVHIKNESPFTCLEFYTTLYTALLGFFLNVKIYRIKAELGTKKAFGNDLYIYIRIQKEARYLYLVFSFCTGSEASGGSIWYYWALSIWL